MMTCVVVFNALRGGENLWNNRCVLIVFVISRTDYTICFFSWNVAKPFLNCLPNSLAFRCASQSAWRPETKTPGTPATAEWIVVPRRLSWYICIDQHYLHWLLHWKAVEKSRLECASQPTRRPETKTPGTSTTCEMKYIVTCSHQ